MEKRGTGTPVLNGQFKLKKYLTRFLNGCSMRSQLNETVHYETTNQIQ